MYIEVHADKFIIKNMNTGKEYEFDDLQEAEQLICKFRQERPDAEFVLYAVLG